MPRPKKHRDFQRILKEHDSRFEFWFNRGKGSHYIVFHPDIGGQRRSCPIPCHAGKDILPCYLTQVIRRFNLPGNIFG